MSTAQTGLVLVVVGTVLALLAPLVARDEAVILNIFRQLLGRQPGGPRAVEAFKWVRLGAGAVLVAAGVGMLLLG